MALALKINCREYQTDPVTRYTLNRIKDRFEMGGTLEDVHRRRSGRSKTSTNFTSLETKPKGHNETSQRGRTCFPEKGVLAKLYRSQIWRKVQLPDHNPFRLDDRNCRHGSVAGAESGSLTCYDGCRWLILVSHTWHGTYELYKNVLKNFLACPRTVVIRSLR